MTGANATPVFAHINQQAKAPRWNFNKYLLNAKGDVVESFGSTTGPESKTLTRAIDAVLQQSN